MEIYFIKGARNKYLNLYGGRLYGFLHHQRHISWESDSLCGDHFCMRYHHSNGIRIVVRVWRGLGNGVHRPVGSKKLGIGARPEAMERRNERTVLILMEIPGVDVFKF